MAVSLRTRKSLIYAHTVRKEPFWLFKKTQRKISKNTLRRAKFLALSGEPIKWPFKKGRFNTSKGQIIWLSKSSKLVAMLLDRDSLAL